MRRFWLSLLCASVLACGGPPRKLSADEERKVFIDTFWEDKQVAHYITAIDALIDRVVADASSSEKISDKNRTRTNNAVLLVVSLTNRPDASVYRVSYSHRPELERGLAKKFAGLVALRLGFSVPKEVMVSENLVFHLEWSVPNSQESRELLASAREQLRAQTSTEGLANYLFLKTLKMEVVEVDAQAGELEALPNPPL